MSSHPYLGARKGAEPSRSDQCVDKAEDESTTIQTPRRLSDAWKGATSALDHTFIKWRGSLRLVINQ